MPENNPYTLRFATTGDAAAIARIYEPYVLRGTASFETQPPGAAGMAARIEAPGGAFPWLVCLEGQSLIGYAYAGRLGQRAGYDWAAAVSIYIDEARRHAGAGRLLYGALLRLLAAQGYRSAWGLISRPNAPSERFHQRMGFCLQGTLEDVGYKFGTPLSVCYYGRKLRPVCQNPPPPCRLNALANETIARCLSEASEPLGEVVVAEG